MAKRKYEFRPDKPASNLLQRLYLTQKQRLSLLKWTLMGLVLLALSVAQDVILCRMRLFGATTDLVPCAIFLMGIYLGSETGSVFALVAACLYQFSGTAPGYHIIAVIPALIIGLAMFRQSYLRKSFGSDLLCAALGFCAYELVLYAIGVVTTSIPAGRIGVIALTIGLSLILMPALYPLTAAIDKIGGETWKE